MKQRDKHPFPSTKRQAHANAHAAASAKHHAAPGPVAPAVKPPVVAPTPAAPKPLEAPAALPPTLPSAEEKLRAVRQAVSDFASEYQQFKDNPQYVAALLERLTAAIQ